MGIIVKLLGGGLGVASEAIHDYRNRSSSRSQQAQSSDPMTPSTSRDISSSYQDPPPQYVEVADEGVAENMIRSGKAERVVDYADEKRYTKSKAAEVGYDDDSSIDDAEDDEAAWELDEMAESVAPLGAPSSYADLEAERAAAADVSEEDMVKKEEQTIRELVRMAGPPPQPIQRLPCAVIIPQRRPRNKDRGFVRAYAPVMQSCGIEQDVFLSFQKEWLAASKSDPWIDITLIAAGIVGFVPELAAQIVSTVVQVTAGTAREVQSRHRRNTFLDRANQELFMPRGLYAMVMAFKDKVPGQQSGGPLSRLAGTLGQTLFSSERLDINQTAAKYSQPDPKISGLKKGLRDIRLVNGKTYTEVELPEAAVLVYPDLDRVVDNELSQEDKGKGVERISTKEKLKGAGVWVQDYMDRKAQATFERDHQGSSLAVPSSSRPGFSSRFSDPSHPANSGSLVSLVTGGKINPGSVQERRERRQERRSLKREYQDERRMARGRSPRGPRRERNQRDKRKGGIIKKILQQDVLYLIIVNLPTREEVEQSVANLERVMST